jgi:uncharacterized protein
VEDSTKQSVSRRDVLKAGTAAAALAAGASLLHAAEPATTTAPGSQRAGLLPVRPLGKTGVEVTVLNAGCGGDPAPRFLDRCYEQGIRYFDTAASYAKGKSETSIAAWCQRTGNRKNIFLVTKDEPYDGIESLLTLIDKRLEALKTDYVDSYFAHGLSVKEFGEQALEWPKSKEFRSVAEKLKKSGKVKYVGFSCHEANIAEYLNAAAEGGFVDVIMLGYSPVLGEKADKFNKALDACHKAGIGLVAMKTMRGIGESLKAKYADKASLAQAVIQAVLSDERIASVCSAMSNLPQVDQNAEAARSIRKPMTSADKDRLRQAVVAAGMAYCPGCDACAGMAGSHVHTIARYLSYYEQDGRRAYARDLYRALPAAARSLSGAQLVAASQACSCGVDYAAIARRAAELLA